MKLKYSTTMKTFNKDTMKIASELNSIYLQTQDFSEACYQIEQKYGKTACSDALAYLDYLKSEENELYV